MRDGDIYGGWLAQFGGSRHGAGTYACMAMAQGLFEFIFPYGKETCIILILMHQSPAAVADLHQQAKRRSRSASRQFFLSSSRDVRHTASCLLLLIYPPSWCRAGRDVAAASPSCLPPLIIRSTCSTTTSAGASAAPHDRSPRADEPGTTWCCFACGCGPMQDSERVLPSLMSCALLLPLCGIWE